MNFPDEVILRHYQTAKTAIVQSAEWRKHAEHLKTVNRFMSGDQRPEALDPDKGEMWFSIPVAVNYAIRTAAMLGGGRIRCFLDPKGAANSRRINSLLREPAKDLFLREQDELMLAARYNRALLDIAARGVAAVMFYPDETRDPDVGPLPNMQKLDPGQFGFMPNANDPFSPTLGSSVVWYDTLVPLPVVMAAFPDKYDALRRMKTYGLGDNFIAEDVRDPLYSLYNQLESEGSGPLSLYEHMDVASAQNGDSDARQTSAIRLVRRSHFFWQDSEKVRGRTVTRWYEADIVEPDGSASAGPKHSVVLSWKPCPGPQPRIVLGSAFNNGQSPYGRGIYGLAGSLFALLDASVTLTYRQLTTAAQLNDMLIVNGDVITDPKQRAVLEAGDKESLLILNKKPNGPQLQQSWRDVIGRLEASAPNLAETRAFVSMVLELIDEVLGQPPVTRGETGTPGQRMSGQVMQALQSSASLNSSPLAFIAGAFLTNIGRAHWSMLQRLYLSEGYVPRTGGVGGWMLNRQVPAEEMASLAPLMDMEVPMMDGEYAIPNGMRTYRPDDMGQMRLESQRPFDGDVIDGLLSDPERRVNVVLNDVSQMRFDVRIVPEGEYQRDLNDFMQRLALFEQYRPRQLTTASIGKKLFEQFPDIDVEAELKARYGEAVVEKVSQVPEQFMGAVDQFIDAILQRSLTAPEGSGPVPANVAAAAPTA